MSVVRLDGTVSDAVDQAILALRDQGVLMERGRSLVEVLVDDRPAPDGEHPSAAWASVVTIHRVMELAETAAVWIDRVKNADDVWEDRPTRPSRNVVQTLMDRRAWSSIPTLRGITETPFPRLDGSIVASRGLDTETGYYVAPSATLDVHVPEGVGLDDAEAAYARIVDVLGDFPFEAPAHQSAAVAALLTLVARPVIAGPVPMVIVTSSTPGSGKSLLVDVLHEIAVGRTLHRTAYPDKDEEFEKRVTALLLAGHAAVCIDNVDGSFGSPTLDSLLTTTQWLGRMLGRSEMVSVPARAVWFATGNNMRIRGDLARRILPIRVEANMERPEDRSDFKRPKILEHVAAHRAELLRDVLVILRAYCGAGRPPPPGMYGSYEAWNALIRGALVWAGAPDPMAAAKAWAEDADEKREMFVALAAAWADVVGSGPVLLSDLPELAEGAHARGLREALRVVAGKGPTIDYGLLGNRLRREKGRWFGRYQWTTDAGLTKGSRRWRLVVRPEEAG